MLIGSLITLYVGKWREKGDASYLKPLRSVGSDGWQGQTRCLPLLPELRLVLLNQGVGTIWFQSVSRYENYHLLCFIVVVHYVHRPSTGCSLNIVFFCKMLWFFWTLQVLLQRWCSTCHCVHTLTPRGNRERPESGIYFKIFEKEHNI